MKLRLTTFNSKCLYLISSHKTPLTLFSRSTWSRFSRKLHYTNIINTKTHILMIFIYHFNIFKLFDYHTSVQNYNRLLFLQFLANYRESIKCKHKCLAALMTADSNINEVAATTTGGAIPSWIRYDRINRRQRILIYVCTLVYALYNYYFFDMVVLVILFNSPQFHNFCFNFCYFYSTYEKSISLSTK